ncbi:copper-translocating P-type ATPase [Bryobacterales bacterium F-183]|nr:copper-translocating P-type ATPase [Bryobacterales bacterium F-183]
MSPSTLRADFRIHGLDCAEEVSLIRRQLDHTKGIHGLGFDVLRGRMSAEFDPKVLSAAEIIERISKTGLKAEPWQDESAKQEPFLVRHGRLIAAVVSGAALLAAMAVEGFGGSHAGLLQGEHIHRASPLLVLYSLIAIVAGMTYSAQKAWGALKLMQPDMNVLVSISIVGACYLGEWSEGATLAFLFSLAGVLEGWSLAHARDAIGSLVKETPGEATVLHGEGAEFHAHCCNHDKNRIHEHRVMVDSVPAGSVVRVKPGERIPFDGKVAAGASGVNEALITGEATPVFKQSGDRVLAGTINTDGLLEIRTTTQSADTTLARIVRLVEESQQQRAPSEQFVERFSRVYTPVMMLIALLVAVVPPLVSDWTWSRAFYQSMVVLLIACPCALVISTPVTIAAAIASAAKRGVLIKGGAFLETAAHLDAIALDKTGVITAGRPAVEQIQMLASDKGEQQFLAYLAGLETGSEHPLAQAILRYAEEQKISGATITEFRALPGRGAEAVIDGLRFWAGSRAYAEARGIPVPDVDESRGASAVYAGAGNEVWGIVLIRDYVRPGIVEAIRDLRKSGVREVTMLTGDNPGAAAQVAKEVELTSFRAAMLPSDKAKAVRELMQKHRNVAMAGDGVNDAEAMAASSLGIAFGPRSTGLAMETAHAVILAEDPARLSFLVRHARRSVAVIKQNLALALGSKLAFLIVALLGSASLWMAVAADMGATLVVTFNGLRMLRTRE